MKIRSIHKESGILDWFKKKKSKPNAPISETVSDSEPEQEEVTIKQPPVFRKKDNPLREREASEYFSLFSGRDNWSDKLNRAFEEAKKVYMVNADGSENQEKTNDVIGYIDTIITHIIKESFEQSMLNFIPPTRIPNDLIDEIRTIVGNWVVPTITKMFDHKLPDLPIVEKVDLSKFVGGATKAVVEAIESSSIYETIHGRFVQEQKSLESEKLQRQKAFEEWQRSQKEQLRHQQDSWAAKKGTAPTSSIGIQFVEKALVNRRNRFNAIIDDALKAYNKGKQMLERNPGMSQDVAFHDLSVILENRFKTYLKFGGDRRTDL